MCWYKDRELVNEILDYACEKIERTDIQEIKKRCSCILESKGGLMTKLVKILHLFPQDPACLEKRKYGAERFFEKLLDKELLNKNTLSSLFVSLWTTKRPFQYFSSEKLEQILCAIDKPIVDAFTDINNLEPQMTIYRGIRGENVDKTRLGYSWSLDEEVAWKFATGDSKCHGYIFSGNVQRDKIIAYFNGRNEQEIVVFPTDVECIKCEFINDNELEKKEQRY